MFVTDTQGGMCALCDITKASFVITQKYIPTGKISPNLNRFHSLTALKKKEAS